MMNRLTGALLGLACGDALGAPAEFHPPAEVRKRWGILTEMVGGGRWDPGEWTDDTGMALCVAEGILSNPEDPVPETGRRFLEWRSTAKDVGSTISAALSAFRGDWTEASRSTPQARSGKAGGNGSLMRTLPVALAYADTEAMLRQSARLSAMTHWDSQAEISCAVYCFWIRAVLDGEGLRPAWHAALAAGRKLEGRGRLAPDTPGPTPLPAEFWERLERVEALQYDDLQPSGYAGYVLECLEAAAWCCLRAGSLEQALILAVNLAGEADTIAAVAGGAAGAAWGRHAIPARWLDRLYRREAVEQTAVRLAQLRLTHAADVLRPSALENAEPTPHPETQSFEQRRKQWQAAGSMSGGWWVVPPSGLAAGELRADPKGGPPLPVAETTERKAEEKQAPDEEELRRHQEVYATPDLPPFDYERVGDQVLAGRNPLTARDVALLAAEGVTHVLDLRQESEWKAPRRFGSEAVEAMRTRGMQRRHLPIRDMGAPAPADLEAACAFLEEALSDPAAHVYVHCRAGHERTAAILIAFHACRHGVSYDGALKALRGGRPTLRPLPEQERAVRKWLRSRQSA